MAYSHIYSLLLLFWTPEQISPSSFLLAPSFLVLLSLLTSHLLFQTLFFSSDKNFPTDLNSTSSTSKSSNIFFFHTSADPPYTYDKTHWIYFSTVASLILILKYNLYAVINPPTLPASPLKTSGLATSMWNPVLYPFVSFTPSSTTASLTIRACIYICIVTSYSCYYLMIICNVIAQSP